MYMGYHGDNKLPAALSHLTPVTHFVPMTSLFYLGVNSSSVRRMHLNLAMESKKSSKKWYKSMPIFNINFLSLIRGMSLWGKYSILEQDFLWLSQLGVMINETLQIMNRDILVSADISAENISLIQLIVSLLLIFLVAKYVLQIEKHQQSTFK